jgi:hypothetical protein
MIPENFVWANLWALDALYTYYFQQELSPKWPDQDQRRCCLIGFAFTSYLGAGFSYLHYVTAS